MVYLFWDQNPGIGYMVTNTSNLANGIIPTEMNYSKNGQQDFKPTVVALNNGTLVLFYASLRGATWSIYTARYSNGLWSPETRLTNSPTRDQYPIALQDSSGKLWVAWTRTESRDLKVKFVDQDGNGVWDPGEPIVYDSNNDGFYELGEPVIYGTTPAPGTSLQIDSRLAFVDSNGDGAWNPGEFVVYDASQDATYNPKIKFVDSDNNNVWDSGETIVYDANSDGLFNAHPGISSCTNTSLSVDCVIVGRTPANNTVLKSDPRLMFVDPDGDGLWRPGDSLVYDSDNNGKYDAGEPAVIPLLSDSRLSYIGSGTTWTTGNTVVYDTDGNRIYDSNIKFVDLNHSGHWDPGDPVVYDNYPYGVYDYGDIPIFDPQYPAYIGSQLKNDPAIRFLDSYPYDGKWDPGEPVVYDSNRDVIYDGELKFVNATTSPAETWQPGKTVVFDTDNNGVYTTGRYHNDTVIAGLMPANRTALRNDPGLKFYDQYGDATYHTGEPVVYDANNNNLYDAETTLSGPPPAPGTLLKADPKLMFAGPGSTWASGNPVVYDTNGNGVYDTGEPVLAGTAPANQTALKYDPKIEFVNATTSPSETWSSGKSAVYDSNANGRYDAEAVISGTPPAPGTGITTGLGQTLITPPTPTVGTTLTTDPRIKYVESDGNSVWDPNEDIIYDVNNTGVYKTGDPVVFNNGTLPAPGTSLRTDPHIRYSDSDHNGIWDSGESVVYDANLNGLFDTGEFLIRGSLPQPGSPLTITAEPVIAGPTPNVGTTLKVDPKVKFVDQNGIGHWGPGDSVVYDPNNKGIYDLATDIVIAGNPLPAAGTPLSVDEITLYGVSVSANTPLTNDNSIRYVDSNNNSRWDPGETVVYDSDNDGVYVAGRYHNDTVITGSAPANNTQLKIDGKLKYSETDGNARWDVGESVLYDANNDGLYDAGDSIVAVFQTPSAGSLLKTDPLVKYADYDGNGKWDPGEPVVYDNITADNIYDSGEWTIGGPPPAAGTSLKSDPNLRFVDSNGDGKWELGKAVVYDSNGNGLYNIGEPVIASGAPAAGTPTRVATHLFYKTYNGSSWSAEYRLTSLPHDDSKPSLGQTKDGRIWVAWAGERGGPDEILYKNTADGSTWTPEAVVAPPGANDDTAPSITQDRNGTIWIAFGRFVPCNCGGGVTIKQDVFYVTSIDNGFHWSTPFDLTQNCAGCSTNDEIEPNLIQLNDKKLYVFFPIVSCGSQGCASNIYYMDNLILIRSATLNGLFSNTVNLRVGQTLVLTATVANNGDYNDTMFVYVKANSTLVASNSSVVRVGQTSQVTVDWVIRGLKAGRYIITANVTDPGEGSANQIANTATLLGTVLIRPAGDVNGDCIVNIQDLVIVATSFGKTVGQPGFNPVADVNGDGVINIADLSIVGATFGQHC